MIDNPNTSRHVGLCLALHDLRLSKYFAGPEWSAGFAKPSSVHGWPSATLRQQRDAVSLGGADRERTARRIDADFDF
jgi:hypothetical protein